MIDLQGPFRNGALFLAISALLHVPAALMGGGMILLAVALFYAALIYGMLLGWRIVAWVTFFCAAIGAMGAMSNIWAFGPVPGWLFSSIAIADLLCVLALFVALWRGPVVKEI